MKNTDILIIGYGEMGQAFEHVLKADRVDIWQRHDTSRSLEEAASNRRFIFFCVPANPVFDIAESIKRGLSPNTICLSIAKGLDESGRPAAMAMSNAIGDAAIQGVIYGPMISEELRADRPGFANIAISDNAAMPEIDKLFSASALHLQASDDLPGLTWCAILKNVYALAFGMADELNLGDNMRGYLAVTAMQELSRLSVALGGKSDTPYGLAGLGDLITTATSEDSHHHTLGRQIARGDLSNLSGEGVHTLQLVREKKILPIQDYPLFSAINQIVVGETQAETSLIGLSSI